MKKVLNSLSVIALVFFTSISIAATPKLELTPNHNKSLTFTLDGSNKELNISLSDIDGHVIFSENLTNEEKYVRRFDLSKLKTGNFFLKVENKLKETTYNIEVTDTTVIVIGEKNSIKPVFRKKADMVYLNLLNLEKKTVKIKIVDSFDRVVFEETVKHELLIEKAFNFKDAYSDSYTVMVTTNNKTYYEGVQVK